MNEIKNNNWTFVRTNSKGEPKFKKSTNEDLEFVENYLKNKGIDYEVINKPPMLWIYHEGRKFQYFYTTGRWGEVKHWSKYPKKHYHSNGINDLYQRFLNLDVFENIEDYFGDELFVIYDELCHEPVM